MTQRPAQPDGFDAEAAINECMDLESAGRPDDLRDLLARARAEDPSFDAKLLQARAAITQLRRPPPAPDVSREVLAEVDYLRPFLSPRRRRQVSATRVAVAAAAVITLSFMAILQRMYPQTISPQPTPGIATASSAAPDSVRSIADAMGELRTPAGRPAAIGRPHRWDGPIWSGPAPTTLSMGDTSRYDGGSNWSLNLTLTPGRPGSPLLDYRASEDRVRLAQTGWPEAPDGPAPVALSLASGGLIELARSSSVVSRLQQERATLDLRPDSALGAPWSGRTELERLFGQAESKIDGDAKSR